MKLIKRVFFLFSLIILILSGCGNTDSLEIDEEINEEIEKNNDTLNESIEKEQQPNSNASYLDQEVPGNTPILFAPGIVSTQHFEHSSITISPDGNEIYWTRIEMPLSPDNPHKIMFSRRIDGVWSDPEEASFSGIYSNDGPVFSPDGSKIYFHIKEVLENGEKNFDIVYCERENDEWSEIKRLSSEINTLYTEGSVSFTSSGEMFFSRYLEEDDAYLFYKSKYDNEVFSSTELVFEDNININVNPYVNRAGDILLFGSVNRPDGTGQNNSDLYVSFLLNDGSWSEPVNLGETINTTSNERFPSLSNDGKYLFFVSNRSLPENIASELPQNGLGDVYWVSADVIYDLKPN